jgi:hypothetical protein
MEGGRWRLDWGECNRESDGSDPQVSESARDGACGARRRG